MPFHLYIGLLVAVVAAAGLTVLFLPYLGSSVIIIVLVLALAVRVWTR